MNAERRVVYSVSSGEYSDYRVHALYEDRADAEAVVERLDDGDEWTGYAVEEFRLYPPGDRSYRRVNVWLTGLLVHDDGSIKKYDTPDVEFSHYEDAHGHLSEPDRQPLVCRHGGQHPGTWLVNGYGDTPEQATKAAKDRAAQVAALVVEGLDPLQVERGRS